MELVRGQVVRSRRGRDVTRVYVVLSADGDRALLCDGKKRTLEAPKQKNPRHIQPTGTVLPQEALASDLSIKMALKEFDESRKAQMQGG